MLPAPTTIATSTPRLRTAATCLAIRSTSAPSVPKSWLPIRASPESFSSMRPKRGSAESVTARSLFADAEVGEAADLDVLARFRRQLLAQLLDRLPLVLLGVDVSLVEQRHFARPLVELALDDLLDHVVGLAFFARLLFEDLFFRLAFLGGNFLGRDVLRRGRRRVQGDLVGEDLELLVAGDEIGLALDFDHRPDLVVGVDIGGDDALAGAAAFALGGRGLALDAQQLDRALDVLVGLDQRPFRVHHRRPSPIPKRLHISSRNAHFDSSLSALSPPVESAASALSAGGAGGCSSDGFASAAAGCSPATVGAGFSSAAGAA